MQHHCRRTRGEIAMKQSADDRRTAVYAAS